MSAVVQESVGVAGESARGRIWRVKDVCFYRWKSSILGATLELLLSLRGAKLLPRRRGGPAHSFQLTFGYATIRAPCAADYETDRWTRSLALLLWPSIVATLIAFWRVRRTAGALLIPYLLWVTFASALNYSVWQLNPRVL